jgi:hypothetical protein
MRWLRRSFCESIYIYIGKGSARTFRPQFALSGLSHEHQSGNTHQKGRGRRGTDPQPQRGLAGPGMRRCLARLQGVAERKRRAGNQK